MTLYNCSNSTPSTDSASILAFVVCIKSFSLYIYYYLYHSHIIIIIYHYHDSYSHHSHQAHSISHPPCLAFSWGSWQMIIAIPTEIPEVLTVLCASTYPYVATIYIYIYIHICVCTIYSYSVQTCVYCRRSSIGWPRMYAISSHGLSHVSLLNGN